MRWNSARCPTRLLQGIYSVPRVLWPTSRNTTARFGKCFCPRNEPVYVNPRKSNELIRVLASCGFTKKESTKQNLGKGHLVRCNKSSTSLLLRLNPRCGRMGKVTDQQALATRYFHGFAMRGGRVSIGAIDGLKEPTNSSHYYHIVRDEIHSRQCRHTLPHEHLGYKSGKIRDIEATNQASCKYSWDSTEYIPWPVGYCAAQQLAGDRQLSSSEYTP